MKFSQLVPPATQEFTFEMLDSITSVVATMRKSTFTRSPVARPPTSGKSTYQPFDAVKASVLVVLGSMERRCWVEALSVNSAWNERVCRELRALASVEVEPGMSLIA